MKIVDIEQARAKCGRPGGGRPAGETFPLRRQPSDAAAESAGVAIPRDPEAVEMLDTRAPRYTSYPTADRFVEAFGPEDYARHLGARELQLSVPLSVYVHIPFCENLCYYCACNKTITKSKSKAVRYVRHLIDELVMVDAQLGGDRCLQQMHWGGGTPTYLAEKEMRAVMAAMHRSFSFSESGEYSIEIDPRTVDDQKLGLLSELGFNRISLGVQDFDPLVQAAVNRHQPEEMVQAVLDTGRSLGFGSTNFDLIYGLPRQNLERFARTIESVIAMRPERIALYNYAHLPARFKAQRLIDMDLMPSADTKQAIFQMANELLDGAGYEYIGMDHFALPEDSLASAHRTGRLHRNFQGYSTQPDCDLVALGASSISRIGSCYSQNLKGVNDYSDRVAQGILPTQRGIELSRDDILRRTLIMAIMCQGEVDRDAFEIAYLIDFDLYFASELTALEPLQRMGFLRFDDRRIVVTPIGRRKALRVISGIFDRYLQEHQTRSTFSKVL